MDKLQQLAPHVTKEANDQANEILSLMTHAHHHNKDHVIYTPTSLMRTLHPLVLHTLTAKGYKVEPIPPSPTFALSLNPTTTYRISL